MAQFRVRRQHPIYIGTILLRLETVGLKILPIAGKIKGEGVQFLSSLAQKLCCQGCHNAGIYTTGKKAAHRHIRHHLPFHRIPYQKGNLLYCLFIAVCMLLCLKLPVSTLSKTFFIKNGKPSRLQFPYSFEHSMSTGTGRTYSKNFLKTLQIRLRYHCRMLKQSFRFWAKDQFSWPQCIKEGFHSGSIPHQYQTIFRSIPNGHSIDSIQLLKKVRSLFHVSAKNHFCICGGGKVVSLPL